MNNTLRYEIENSKSWAARHGQEALCGQLEPAAGASSENPARGVSRRHVDEPVCGDHPVRKPANQRGRKVSNR